MTNNTVSGISNCGDNFDSFKLLDVCLRKRKQLLIANFIKFSNIHLRLGSSDAVDDSLSIYETTLYVLLGLFKVMKVNQLVFHVRILRLLIYISKR